MLLTIGNADPPSGKVACERSFSPAPPTHLSPCLADEHLLGRDRQHIRDVVLSRLTSFLCWEDHSNIGLIDHLSPRQADRPRKHNNAQPTTEWGAGKGNRLRQQHTAAKP